MMEVRILIPVEESFTGWHKDPEYAKAYDALEDKFVPAATMIEADHALPATSSAK
jgi:hypothetical protein